MSLSSLNLLGSEQIQRGFGHARLLRIALQLWRPPLRLIKPLAFILRRSSTKDQAKLFILSTPRGALQFGAMLNRTLHELTNSGQVTSWPQIR